VDEVIFSFKRRCNMPGFDGTGPRGQGSMTGGGFGPCNTKGLVYGRGRGGVGYGCGRGMGRGRGYANTPTAEELIDDLKKEKDLIDQRIKDLENSKK
jgi:hypothetical protein